MDTSESYAKSIVDPSEPLEKVEVLKWYDDPVYIKMCDCEEIQAQWEPNEGDWLVEKHYFDLPLVLMEGLRCGFITGVNWGDDDPFDKDNSIWLPRQDQLQAMVLDSYREHWGDAIYPGLMEEAVSFAGQYHYASMEQLWLAFVMKEKYNKVWNGEKWVKEVLVNGRP